MGHFNSRRKIKFEVQKFSVEGPIVWHMELCLMLYGSLDEREEFGRECICV